jgi:3-(3-hydroxy-phenyl)propionate hydroxylase
MFQTYSYPRFDYRQTHEQQTGTVNRHPVVIVGAGPVGLTQALDLARRGVASVVLDDDNTVSIGSRAVCYAKRPLEIWDRLGVGEEFAAQGVQWKVGKVFFKDDLAYQFDLLPEEDHKMPAMVNYQQYHLEERLVKACAETGLVDIRWKHKVLSLQQHDDHVNLNVETPDGIYRVQAQWVVACDGANSSIRGMVGADFSGQYFQDRFLIADVVMKADFPTERWFWFDPPFHRNQSVLLHKQSDNVWRIDFQLGWNADPVEEKKTGKGDSPHPGHVGTGRRLRARVGIGVPVRLSPHRPVPSPARDFCGRRGASGVAFRSAWCQHRCSRLRQPGLEAQGGDRWSGAGGLARHL